MKPVRQRSKALNDAKGQQGFALLIVLWSVVVLSLIATSIVASGRSETQRSTNMLSAVGVETAANSAIQVVAFRLIERAPGWSADGAPHVLSMPNGITVEVRVRSEEGKVNPNTAWPGLLAALFQAVGADPFAAESVANNILLWRVSLLRPEARNPAADAYAAAGLAYGPPGAPFRNLDEVGAVLGMTPELLARVRPYLSLYARNEPNPRYAMPPVLLAMGVDSTIAGGARVLQPALIVDITANASGANGAHYIRDVTAQLSSDQSTDPIRILTWDRLDN